MKMLARFLLIHISFQMLSTWQSQEAMIQLSQDSHYEIQQQSDPLPSFNESQSNEQEQSHRRYCDGYCHLMVDDGENQLFCHEIHSLSQCDSYQDVTRSVRSLRIEHGHFHYVHSGNFTFFPNLTSLILRYNHNLSYIHNLSSWPHLQSMTVSNNSHLQYFPWDELANFVHLKRANFSWNHFTTWSSSFLRHLTQLRSLDISGNHWLCTNPWRWVLDWEKILENSSNLTCIEKTESVWWGEARYSIVIRERYKQTVDEQCANRTKGCECHFQGVGKQGRDTYTVEVNCSHLHLTSLPESLPENTIQLNVTGNYLRNLSQVRHYKNLTILLADYNQITSIKDLSDTAFIASFRQFSLRHNRIPPEEIPLAQLTSSLDNRQKYVFLYNNSWECSCHTAKEVREWLLSNRAIVNDSLFITCSGSSGKEIQVLYLFPETICPQQNMKEDDMYAIIAVEAILIVFVLTKLIMDFWNYHRHGEVPWFASKLKLCC